MKLPRRKFLHLAAGAAGQGSAIWNVDCRHGLFSWLMDAPNRAASGVSFLAPELRWFCKLGIEDRIPDHSVFCRARHERFRESDALRRVFEGVVATCIAAGLVGGEAFSIDALPMRCLGVLRAVRHPSTGVSALMRSRRQTETKIYFQNLPPI
jgi:hypothetical protein